MRPDNRHNTLSNQHPTRRYMCATIYRMHTVDLWVLNNDVRYELASARPFSIRSLSLSQREVIGDWRKRDRGNDKLAGAIVIVIIIIRIGFSYGVWPYNVLCHVNSRSSSIDWCGEWSSGVLMENVRLITHAHKKKTNVCNWFFLYSETAVDWWKWLFFLLLMQNWWHEIKTQTMTTLKMRPCDDLSTNM